MLSKACIVGAYQRKLEEIAATPNLELVVAVPPSWRDERGVIPLERSHTQGYRLVVLPLALNGQFHLHFYPTFGQLVREVRPELVHLDEEPYNFATFHANLLARRAGAKTLWFSWQNLQRTYPPPFAWWERYNLRHCEYALVGNATAVEVWRAKGYAGPLAIVPQFGVDPQVFAPPPSRPESAPHVAYAGRFVPEKGADLLLTALAGLPGDWRVTLLGGGPEQGYLQTLATTLGLAERVAFRPFIPSAEMPDFYRSVDLLVLPSRSRPNWIEQFGRVLVEAMACGVAVIGSSCGEIPQVIGDAGLIFPEGDVAALQAALARLLAAPGYRRTLGERGRARVLAHFTQQQVAVQTVAVYREILESSRIHRRHD